MGITITRLGDTMVTASALSPGARWLDSYPSLVIPKTFKMVRAASLLDSQHLKRIEHGQTLWVGIPWERGNVSLIGPLTGENFVLQLIHESYTMYK